MTVLTKLITGVHTHAATTVLVAGTPGATPPPLTVVPAGASPYSVPYSAAAGGWQTTLAAGNYILKIETTIAGWFAGAVQINVVDQSTVTFVFHGPETPTPNRHTTIAWASSTALAGNDPKDPWPPPGPNPITLTQSDFDYFDTALHTARVNVQTPKAA